jgi:hypothetical protein
MFFLDKLKIRLTYLAVVEHQRADCGPLTQSEYLIPL